MVALVLISLACSSAQPTGDHVESLQPQTMSQAGAEAVPAVEGAASLGGASALAGASGTAGQGGAAGQGHLAPTPSMAGQTRDVCAFDAPVELAPSDVEGMVWVPPAHPAVAYLGRTDCLAQGGPRFAFPAVSTRIRFVGTDIDVLIGDAGQGSEQTTNFYDLVIDDAAPVVLEVNPTQDSYRVARGLSLGEHVVEVSKRTESAPGGAPGAGVGQWRGFRLNAGAELLNAEVRERKLEFIGDSITVGYGNEVSTDDPANAPYTSRHSNGNRSYGALVARALDAEYLAVAYSGRGVYRNIGGSAGKTLPQMYLDILPDRNDGPTWSVGCYTPDAVVINLGTNDFSPGGVDRELYREAYSNFLLELRALYPEAQLVAAVGPMMTDAYPPSEQAWTSIQSDVEAVVTARNADGDARVHFHAFSPQTSPYGEDWHPTVATHEAMARSLGPVIAELLGW